MREESKSYAREAMDIVEHAAHKIGSRLPGSDGEIKFHQYMGDKLRDIALLYGVYLAKLNAPGRDAREALQKLEDRHVQLHALIARAGIAVEEMNKAGQASALIIEKATRIAVEKAVQAALANVQQQTKSTLGDSVTPAVRALHGVTARAE